ncbi:AraC family transcriptional regulator [Diaphorobacter sp.]|uniref:helix-turn-helix transcriptional regulator n=1 Tax=Diaphorobacter sp. TaxID=1934310 RepID=UPI002586D284|nr:AraC family transcriptional regulator [Diaphorobacter sp.]
MHGHFPCSPSASASPCCVVTPGNPPAEPALRDHLARLRELRPGLLLHWEDAPEAGDLTVQAEIEAGLRIVLLLEGAVDVSYGAQRVALASARGGASAVLVAVAEQEQLTRRTRRGVYSRRVNLGLGHNWLAQCGAFPGVLDDFMHRHLEMRPWQVSPRAVAIAEQIVHPPQLEPLLQSIYLESRALELAGEALGTLHQHPTAPPAPAPAALRPREHQRLRELHAFLGSGQADGLSLDEIARHAGVNANTLQRQFRAVYGTTVFDHLRDCRLQRARHALEHEGLTVGQAAGVAGYTSAANFATAYRRRFGHPPKLARSRV